MQRKRLTPQEFIDVGMMRFVKILLWLLAITGVVYALKVFGILPMHHPECMWLKVHTFLGIVTLVMALWHCIDHWKWYKAWLRGRLKNRIPNVVLVKWTTCFFFLTMLVLLLDWAWPSKALVVAHIATASVWIALSAKHCKSKSRHKNNCRNGGQASNVCHCRR